MNRIVFATVMFAALGTSAASAQDRGNLAMPYRFRLPFLEKGEYVLSAFGGNISQVYSAQFADTPAKSSSDNNDSSFDVNGLVALSKQLLVSAEFTVYPHRTTQKYVLSPGSTIGAFSFEDDVRTHVAVELTAVYRPVERFEISAFYFQDTTDWSRANSDSDPLNVVGFDDDINDFRIGVTYFGKF